MASKKYPSPRKIKGGTKAASDMTGNYWKSVDPVIPIIALDVKMPTNKDMAAHKYGKGRKSNPKKNGKYL